MPNDHHEEPDRYASAAGWDGRDRTTRERDAEGKKLRDKYRKDHARDFYNGSALKTEDANTVFTEAQETEPAGPRQIFGDLFREGELAVLFADTGIGKSVLAVQIADAIARGTSALGPHAPVGTGNRVTGEVASPVPCPSSLATPQQVIYIDFELTNAQFAERYSSGVRNGKYHGRHRFPKILFQRSRIEWDGEDIPEGFKDLNDVILHSVGQLPIEFPDARVLIVDNITYLSGAPTSTGPALALMKTLKLFKQNLGLSILVLAHTPKRPYARPLTENDIQGSKMFSNFADSIFAIGRDARDPDLRYIKEIKTRMARNEYGKANVITCRLLKKRGFLHFQWKGFADEHEHLTRPYDNPNGDRERLIEETRRLHANGLSQRSIARRLGLSITTVRRYLSWSDE